PSHGNHESLLFNRLRESHDSDSPQSAITSFESCQKGGRTMGLLAPNGSEIVAAGLKSASIKIVPVASKPAQVANVVITPSNTKVVVKTDGSQSAHVQPGDTVTNNGPATVDVTYW